MESMMNDANKKFFRESIQKAGHGEAKIARRRGMRNEYAHVRIGVRPGERGRGVILEWNAGAKIPAFFSKAVLLGIQDALQAGLAGLEVTDIVVNVEAGSYHDVDSNEPVFREMAQKAMQQAIEQAGPILLEAMSLVLITLPAAQVEVAELAVGRLGGEATPAVKKADGTKTLAANMPSAAVNALVEELLSATRGSATISSRSNGYRPSLDSQEGSHQPVVQPTRR